MRGKFSRITSVLLVAVLSLTGCGSVAKRVAEAETAVQSMETIAESIEEKEASIEEADVETSEELDVPEVSDEIAETVDTPESQEKKPHLIMSSIPGSHKLRYVQILENVIAQLPEEKPESSLKQADVECDTLQWLNATYAMFVHSTGCDYHLIAGYSDESDEGKDDIKRGLEESWGITDRQTTIDTLTWLALEGHVATYSSYIQIIEENGWQDCTAEEIGDYLWEDPEVMELSIEDTEWLLRTFGAAKDAYDICGDNGIDAWDYCRIMQICGDCYFAGYLTLEECLTIQLATARVIQHEFDSWQEMNDSYYYGYVFWVDDEFASYFRKAAYDELMEMDDSPYKILDFDMPLEEFW